MKRKYYPEWIRGAIFLKKWRTLIDHTSNTGYNGIAYSVKRLARRDLLGGMTLAKPMHQDVDTS